MSPGVVGDEWMFGDMVLEDPHSVREVHGVGRLRHRLDTPAVGVDLIVRDMISGDKLCEHGKDMGGKRIEVPDGIAFPKAVEKGSEVALCQPVQVALLSPGTHRIRQIAYGL